MPNSKSAILIGDFESPRHLAEHLMYLNEEDAEYNAYLDHKMKEINETISNDRLLKALADRTYERETIIRDFECHFCKHAVSRRNTPNQLHYDCASSASFAKMDYSSTGPTSIRREEEWKSVLRQGQCEAEVFALFVQRNVSFSNKDYSNELQKRFESGTCAI